LISPTNAAELAQALRAAALENQIIRLGGAFSKDGAGGPLPASATTITTAAMTKVLQYEPKDLTISVEAGMPYRDLTALVAENRQMIPLDPPFAATATIGGVLAANCSGPRRRLFGTARDLVIGMQFATLEGKLVQSGGMVVKNVAGLDMSKLMIGSLGTLAAIATVNFKLIPMPQQTRTFILPFHTVEAAMEGRALLYESSLQPFALDLLNPAASKLIGRDKFQLLVQAGGSEALMDRYFRSLKTAEMISGGEETALWDQIREFTPAFLAANPNGAVSRISRTVTNMTDVQALLHPVLTRAATGVSYVYCAQCEECPAEGLIEYSPAAKRAALKLWPSPGPDFPIMEKVKHMFDPQNLLNPGRLYGRI
jgi:glycolate oxidase FAD binding subunit